MSKPTIFIASSERAKLLAEKLKEGLEDSHTVWLWSHVKEKVPGTTITGRLLARARQCDFAAMIFTKDDRMVRDRTKRALRVPRDNCIFEAGLFTGALGAEFERCFLISGVPNQEALPSDLRERENIPFPEPKDLRDPVQCASAIQSVVQQIKDIARATFDERPIVPVVTKDKLITLEQKKPGPVVVNSVEPLEKDHKFATRVMSNMKEGIRYRYFFHGNRRGDGTDSVWDMIHMLAMSDLATSEHLSLAERLKIMQDLRPQVEANLEAIQDRLSVYFLPHETPISFCVHHAETQEAKCYVRYLTGDFIEWHSGDMAKKIAADLGKQRVEGTAVFRSTNYFYLDAPDNQFFLGSLRSGLKTYFAEDLRKKAEETCLGCL